jgi:REP element-mobilizing transposase RayT
MPHWEPKGAALFLTWTLEGSMPRHPELLLAQGASEGQRFSALDRELDMARVGPTWLANEAVALCVVETLLLAQDEWKLCELISWVVMSNHVHVLLQPLHPLRNITRAIKKVSARRANLILGWTGLRFWQEEGYDHWVRNLTELGRISRYVEWNPVRAGLVKYPEFWRFSSVFSSKEQGRSEILPHRTYEFFLISSLAALTTASGVNPNFF